MSQKNLDASKERRLKLYYVPRSRSTRVLWTLEELGVPYELVVMAPEERFGEEHRARHPLGRVPVIEFEDGRLLFESAAICMHLADLHPDAGLMPPFGSAERAIAYQWILFAMTELEKRVFDWLFASRRGEDVTEHATGFEPVRMALTAGLADKQWLTGDAFTVADLLCGTMLANAYHRELLTDDGPLRAFAERAQSRPAAQRAHAIDLSHR